MSCGSNRNEWNDYFELAVKFWSLLLGCFSFSFLWNFQIIFYPLHYFTDIYNVRQILFALSMRYFPRIGIEKINNSLVSKYQIIHTISQTFQEFRIKINKK